MLCYRCGSHNQDGSAQCENCGQVFTQSLRGSGQRKSAKVAPPKSAPYMPKDRIGEHYEVVSLLGHGPSGYVYRVIDETAPAGADREVAIKVMHGRLLQTVADRQAFQKALTRARKMAHPGIVRVYSEGEDQGRLYFTMQLLAGLPLSRIIELRQGEKAFSLKECEPLVAQLVQALDYSHRFTAHGGLKPSNIMVQPDDVKITDFMTMRGLPRRPYLAALGSALNYVAPELRADGADVLPAADVFSLGVILAEMLTGKRPETTKGRIDLGGAELLPQVRGFLLKAMEMAPDKRWRSPNELLQALSSLVDEPMSEPVIITAPVPVAAAKPPPLRAPEPPPLAREPVVNEAAETGAADAGDLADLNETTILPAEPAVQAKQRRDEPPSTRPISLEGSLDAELDLDGDGGLDDETLDSQPRSALIRRREDRVGDRKGSARVAAAILMIGVMLAGVVVWARTTRPAWFDRFNARTMQSLQAASAPVVEMFSSVTGTTGTPASAPIVPSFAAVPSAPAQEAAPEQATSAPATPVLMEQKPEAPPPAEDPTPTRMTPPPLPAQAPPAGLTQARPEPPRPETRPPREKKDRSGLAHNAEPASLQAPVITSEAKDKFGCPHGMVFVPGGRFSMGSSPSDEFHNFSDKLLSAVDVRPFCVDRYEYPNQVGGAPLVNVSFRQAKQSCEAAGKRLCGEDEWERACKGPAGTRFPYGNEFEEGTCNVGKDDQPKAPRASGASQQCRSGFGVVDMSGNVAEWTSSPMAGGDFILKGGDAAHPDYASRCANRAAMSSGKRSASVGFRCCAEPE